MMKILKQTLIMTLLLLPSAAFAWQWLDLWQTPDQQGVNLLQKGKAKEAAHTFKNKDWQAVSLYRAGEYDQAFKKFSGRKTSDDQYNAGNAAAYVGHYDAALAAYDKAIAINPDNSDAITNREIVKKIKEQKQSQQDKSSDKNKNDTKDADNKSGKNSGSDQKNDSAKNNEQSNPQNKTDQDKSDKQKSNQDNSSKQADNSSSPQKNQPSPANQEQQKQADNATQQPDNQSGDGDPQNATTQAASGVQTKDEANKQMLRRLADDPGGLLRQKFMRDYLRRHSSDENPGQGDDNGVQ
jgi:Ca-activated chloride channel family protein